MMQKDLIQRATTITFSGAATQIIQLDYIPDEWIVSAGSVATGSLRVAIGSGQADACWLLESGGYLRLAGVSNSITIWSTGATGDVTVTALVNNPNFDHHIRY